MKKIFKIWALVAVLVLSLCPTFAIATSTATTLEDIFIGEYDSGDLSGFAHIVFGTISDMDAEYGIVLTDVEEGKSYAFKGKSIGDDGKFGIAVYDMPMGKEFKAKVYSGNPVTGVFGEEVSFVTGDENTCNELSFSYVDNGDNTLTVTLTISGDTVRYAGIQGTITFDDSVLTFVSSKRLSYHSGSKPNADGNIIYFGFAGEEDVLEEEDVLSLTFSYTGSVDTSLDLFIEELYSCPDDPMDDYIDQEYTIRGCSIVIE
ncbi:MAG: hypothetical protein IJF76_01995 [Clostridia bacterium]|nr:hypothetical protein [Clostridia bacterium]